MFSVLFYNPIALRQLVMNCTQNTISADNAFLAQIAQLNQQTKTTIWINTKPN